jgi:hypothetical protein
MDKKRNGSLLLIGTVLVLLLAVIGGIALAQEATPEATPPAENPAPEDVGPDEAPRLRGFGHWGGFGRLDGDSNWLTYLAEALGITVDELTDAQERAYQAALADAVAAGQLTQEQADNILARRALKNAIDRNAILAEALGLTVDELNAALAGGQSLADLMTAQGIDSATLMANAQAAYEAAVQQAVADGVITQAQADAILSSDSFGPFGHGELRGFGFGGGRGHGGRHHGRGFDGFGLPDATTPEATPDTTGTSLDA